MVDTLPFRPHVWGDEWTSEGSHPGAVFRACQSCTVRVCTVCAPNFATDTSCPKQAAARPLGGDDRG